MIKPISYAEFCTGVGGFRLGIEASGIKAEDVYTNEIDDNCEKTYKRNFGIGFDSKDIFKIDSSALPDFDMLCAGFPCQPFSAAGKELGFKDMSELLDEDIEVADVEVGENEYLYVFTFVVVITVAGRVLKCYPKYLLHTDEPKDELKQILKALEKYNSKEQIIRMFNDNSEHRAFNLLAVFLFLLYDYYENGSYNNSEIIIESNGSGEILWDRTINDSFTLISNNRPYYLDLQTQKRVNDNFDYIKRLHECVLTLATKELDDAGLVELFDIFPVNHSDEALSDFGEKDYILYRIEKKLNVQFSTRKQLLLKTLYAYVSHSSALYDTDCFSMFGTNSFNLVWERVCADILDNKLQCALSSIHLPTPLKPGYDGDAPLVSLIEKPKWNNAEAKDTLIPDIISINANGGTWRFIIFDAKYYNAQIESGKPLRAQPGVESVTKQYLYQLAYKEFVEVHGFDSVRNCFLMPTEKTDVLNKGVASMEMLNELGLQQIQVRFISATVAYAHYLQGSKFDIAILDL